MSGGTSGVDPSDMRRGVSPTGVVLIGACLAAGIIGGSPSHRAASVLLGVTALLSGALILVATSHHRPPNARPWRLLAAAQVAFALGGAAIGMIDPGSASGYGPESLLLVPGYLLTVAAVVLLVRPALGSSGEAALDASVGAVALVAIFWAPVVERGLNQPAGIVFVAMDALLAVIVFRSLFSPTGSQAASRLLMTAMVAAACASGIRLSGAGGIARHLVDGAYALALVLAAAAASSPSMRELPMRVRASARPDRRGVVVVSSALFAPLVGMVVERLVYHHTDVWPYLVLSAALVPLVVARLAGIVAHTNELRRRAEASEEKFRLVFESAGAGISIGVDGMLTETNPAYQAILGYTGEELADMHYIDITHPDDVELDVEEARLVASGELRHYTFEKRIVRKDGETRWLDVTVSLAADGQFGISINEDITERKQLEDDLRQAQKMEAVGTLAGGVAHDFNNLMTAVLGYADILKRELPPGHDDLHEAVDVIASSATRAGDLTKQLLAFSRRQVLRLAPTDLADVVRRFEPILRRVIPENIRLEFDLMPGAVARADEAQLEQILLNLVVNARDAMPEGGTITIGVQRNGDAVLSVSDTGVGIDEETRQHIFEPFFTTKGKNAGTGLGLSTVDGIVAQSGGTIDVRSAPGAGATFAIHLPLDDGVQQARPLPREAAPATAHGHVLLAEDEDAVRNVTVQLLELAGYDAVAAASGEQALDLLRSGELQVDVLVTDMIMTGMNGLALARQARALRPDLPVVFISGYSDDLLSGDELGEGSDLLTKPFSPADLAERIERVRYCNSRSATLST